MAAAPSSDQQERDRSFAVTALPLLPMVARVAQALTRDAADADDLVQETFLRAYRYWDSFQSGTDCQRWLAAICRNTFLEMRRREVRSLAVEAQELDSIAAAQLHMEARASGVDDMFSRLDLGPAIQQAVAALDPLHRDVVLLVDVDDFSYEQAAALLDVPIGTIRSRLYRARRQLQEALIAHAIDSGLAKRPDSSASTTPSRLPRRA